ncbi:MAG TPA: ABC transporter substrate-binding protein [Actinomycetota bacterium]|nr:ABC transporter substrate-binding protein [Actinomycetota bacterium]
MALSLLAALGLGVAVGANLGNGSTTTVAAVTQTGGPAPATQSTATGGAQAIAGTAARTITSGGTEATQAGALSTSSTGVANGVITVGGIFDETGPVDSTVERDVVRAYFNKINDSGGVNGYKLRLIDCDSAYDPTQAHQCSLRLLSEGVLAFVGNNSVSGEEPETKYLTQQGVPIIGGLGVPAEFNSPISYPVVASFVRDGWATGTHSSLLGIKAPAVVLVSLNFIQPAEQALLDSLHKHNIHETSVNLVDITKPDYTDLVIKLRRENPDAVLAGLDPYSYARFFQAMQRADWHPKFGGLGLDKPSAQADYGTEVYGAESLTSVIEPEDHASDPAIEDYHNTVQHYFPNQMDALDYFSEGDWVAAKVFVQGIRLIGKNPVNRKTLVDAMNSIKNFDTGLTVPISFAPGPLHDSNHCYQWIRNEQGTWTTYSNWTCIEGP